ncbi:unnamed protein product, partial [marine sediment metagenome]
SKSAHFFEAATDTRTFGTNDIQNVTATSALNAG